jgi:hypothetical protein
MKIAVLCPTRNRPDQASALAASMRSTSHDAELLLYVDDDQVDLYASLMDQPRVRVTVGPQVGVVGAYNALAAQSDHEILGLGIDDSTFLTAAWDRYVYQTVAYHFPGRIGVVAPTHAGIDHLQFGYVSRQWVQALGWFAPPVLHHFTPDTVMQILGDATRIEYADPTRFSIRHQELPTQGSDALATDTLAFTMWCAAEFRHALHRLRRASWA